MSSAVNISGLVLFAPKKFDDPRGYFSEVYNRRTLEKLIGEVDFVQDNHSLSVRPGTIRGLHFQIPPSDQGKLVRVVRGAIYDVAVDIRRGSPTYGRYMSVILSAENWQQFWIPPGFAHGFCTIEPNSEVIYKVTNYYNKNDERGIIWNDREVGIDWPVKPGDALLSEQDLAHPPLSSCAPFFEYP